MTRAWGGGGRRRPRVASVIAGGRLIVHSRQGTREIVRALDLRTGAVAWQDAYDAPYQMNPPPSRTARSGSPTHLLPSRTAACSRWHQAALSAYDLASGARLWRTPPADPLPLYGTASSPIVDGSRVIAFMGGHDAGALTAFDAASGAVRWRWTGDGPGYASPVVARLAGTRQLVTQSQSSLVGLAADTGALLWRVPLRTNFDQNSVTPLVVGDLVISAGLETPTTAYRVTRDGTTWRAVEVWANPRVSLYMSSPAASDEAVFGLSHRNRGQFFALDPATGRTLWTTRGREADNASIVRAGPWLLLSTTNGELIVARASADRFDEVRRYVVTDSAMWAHPALAGRTIAVKDTDRVIVWTVEGEG
ncbi:MAG: PQQ-binding-like beta-propeller repeat protein [Vicinamibacterales bacterium]